MKKLIALLLALVMTMAMVACSGSKAPETQAPETQAPETQAPETQAPETQAPETEATEGVTVMTHAEYVAAAIDDAVVIECYIQANQSWWDNKVTLYGQDQDGAYFMYEMACSEEDAAKLIPGTKIRVTGFKGEWAGEVEIMDGTFEFVELAEGEEPFIAEALDVTELLGTEEIINHQNQKVAFKGMTVEAIEYKNGEPGDDIYLTLGYNGASYSFCVEIYLTGAESEVYTTVGALQVGDVVDVEGFLYWYEGMNPHVTAITVAE